MLEFKNLYELKEGPVEVYNEMEPLMRRLGEELHEDDYKNIDFIDHLGGHVFILESLEDLKLIELVLGGTLYDNVQPFDIALILSDTSFMVLVSITSDTGGATYFLPREVYMQSAGAMLSLIETHRDANFGSLVKDGDL